MMISEGDAEMALMLQGLPPLHTVTVEVGRGDLEMVKRFLLTYLMTLYEVPEASVLTDRCVGLIPQKPS